MTLQNRQRLAFLILALSIGVATFVAIPRGQRQSLESDAGDSPAAFLLGSLDLLNGFEIAHIMGHVVVFGGVAALLGHWGQPRGGRTLAMRYVWAGALLMEGLQFMVGFKPEILLSLSYGVAFDVALDWVAARGALWLTYIWAQRA